MITPKFINIDARFHQDLKKRVYQYFQDTKKSMTGNWNLYSKAILFITIYLAILVHLLFFTPVGWLAILECVLMGGLTAAIGFNVMHDGAHGSFSPNKSINKIAALTVNALGASHIMWNIKHNILHHTYTNVDGVDDDIEAKPFLRLAKTQKRYWIHRFQHYFTAQNGCV